MCGRAGERLGSEVTVCIPARVSTAWHAPRPPGSSAGAQRRHRDRRPRSGGATAGSNSGAVPAPPSAAGRVRGVRHAVRARPQGQARMRLGSRTHRGEAVRCCAHTCSGGPGDLGPRGDGTQVFDIVAGGVDQPLVITGCRSTCILHRHAGVPRRAGPAAVRALRRRSPPRRDMRALQITRFGGPEVLDVVDIPDPVPADGEVLHEVSSSGVNCADTHHPLSSDRPWRAHWASPR